MHLQAESNRVCIGAINPNQIKGIDVGDMANPAQVWTNSLSSQPGHVLSDGNDVYSSHNAAGLSHSYWGSDSAGFRYNAIPAYGRVAIVGNRVYAPTTSGMDIRDRYSLNSVIGAFAAGATGNALAVDGDYAYLAADNGLHVVDIRSETAPTNAGFLSLASSDYQPKAVELFTNHACLIFKNTNLLMVVDIASPTNPHPVGGYSFTGPTEDLAVSDGSALVLARSDLYGSPDLHAIGLSAPENPSLQTRLHLNGISREIALVGNTLFVADGNNGLCILDVGIPSAPGLIVQRPSKGTSTATADGLAYMGDETGFSVFDVSNPEAPVLVTNAWQSAQYLEVAENRLYSLGGAGFPVLAVTDITNNFAVVETKYLMNDVYAFSMAGDQFALLVTRDWMTFLPTLEIVDVQSPGLPSVTNYSGGAEIVDVVGWKDASGTNAFLATTNGFEILDLSDPNDIHSIGDWNCPAGYAPNCICTDGERIALASTNHLWVIDRNELGGGNPIFAEADIHYSFSEMILSGNLLYAAAGTDGVIAYQIGSAVARPTLFIADSPPDQVTLQWHSAGTGWLLQQTDDPGSPESWSNLTGSDNVTSTNLPRGIPPQFFRLRQQLEP